VQSPRCPFCRQVLGDLVEHASSGASAIEDGDPLSARSRRSPPSPWDCADHACASQLLLTPEQVAQALAIGRTRVYELMASGALPSVRLGRSRRVARHALCRYVDALHDR